MKNISHKLTLDEHYKVSNRVLIAYSADDMYNSILGDNDLKIVYDARLDAYLYGNGLELNHFDLVSDAFDAGYYKDITNSSVSEYISLACNGDGTDGEFGYPWMWFMVYCLYNDEIEANIDLYPFVYRLRNRPGALMLDQDEIDLVKLNTKVEGWSFTETYILDESWNITRDTAIAYSIKDMLKNMSDVDLRILYDKKLDAFLFGDANNVIHNDLYNDARTEGYYNEIITRNSDFETLNDYIDCAEDGYFDENDDYFLPWAYRLIYVSPKSEDLPYYLRDGYREKWPLKQGGFLFMRDGDIYETPFKNCIEPTSLTFKQK